jgi:hypothetical protein
LAFTTATFFAGAAGLGAGAATIGFFAPTFFTAGFAVDFTELTAFVAGAGVLAEEDLAVVFFIMTFLLLQLVNR